MFSEAFVSPPEGGLRESPSGQRPTPLWTETPPVHIQHASGTYLVTATAVVSTHPSGMHSCY